MRSDYSTITLAEAVDHIVDNRGRTAPTSDSGIPLIATNCITNERLFPSYDTQRFVSEETYTTWFRSHPEPMDVILTLKGSKNGAACIAPDPVDFVIAQDMVALRTDPEKIDPKFLLAALRYDSVQHQIKAMDVSGAIPHFKKGDFDKLVLPYPERSEREFIGNLYFDMSEKIELNRRMCETLESLARAVFRSWFVDFEPVRANAEAAGHPNPLGPPPQGYRSLPHDLASLFPDHFECSDFGTIPAGWQQKMLGAVVEIKDSQRIPLSKIERAKRQGNVPYHGATGVMDYVDTHLFDGIHLLVGEDGSVTKENGTPFLQYVWGQFWVNNHAHVLTGVPPVSTEHVYIALASRNIEQFVTGAVQKKLNQRNLNRIPFLDPGGDICRHFDDVILPLFASRREKLEQNKTLATIRDTLLPRLMSGELEVGIAE